MEQEEYIKKWLDGSLTESEKIAFEKTKDYRDVQKIDQYVKKMYSADYAVSKELDRLKSQLPPKDKQVQVNWMQYTLRIAAAVTLVIMAYFSFNYFNTAEYFALSGEQVAFFLPDSSEVTLNSLSAVTYKKLNWKDDRVLQLNGEAYFDVEKGSSFKVITPDGQVTVLGTRFNVLAREGYFEVRCFEGKVNVKHDAQNQVLTADQRFVVVNNQANFSTSVTAESPSWMANRSTFEGVPFRFVVEELERQYGVEVRAEQVDLNALFTGGFTHDDLDLALKSITIPLKLGYEKSENEITLTRDR